MTDADADLKKFTCRGCGYTGFDIQESFSGTPSTRCIWCSKYGSPKKPAAEAKQIKGSDAADKA